jgi:hypothetical protein
MKTSANILLVLLLLCQSGHAQGFVNLNFESANLSAYGAGPAVVPTTNAIPGWTAYIFGSPQTSIVYNSISLGAAQVNLEGTNSGFPKIQGNYFILLQGDSDGEGVSAAVGQTGEIPPSAQSITFWGNNVLNITFAGQNLTFTQIGSAANYNIYSAGISAYAGQTGQLLFTATSGTSDMFDNIQFSSSPVPEPATLALAALGIGVFAGLRRRQLTDAGRGVKIICPPNRL